MKKTEPSQTAEKVALTRAIETLLPKNRRICSDPYAKYFLEGRMKRIYNAWLLRKIFCARTEIGFPGVMGSVLARTRFIDDYLREQVASGIKQIVILGAGYDTRALRLETVNKTVKIFEVDHPATQKRKISLIKQRLGSPSSNIIFVPVRFNSQNLGERLFAGGYRKDNKTLFIWEGVTYYLSDAAVDDTLRFVAENSSAGSLIVFDYFPPSVANGTSKLKEAIAMRAFFAQLGEELTFGIAPDEMKTFLSARGFGRISNVSREQLKKKYFKGETRKRQISPIFCIVHAMVLPDNQQQFRKGNGNERF